MNIYRGFSHWKWWFSIVMWVYQRVYWWMAVWQFLLGSTNIYKVFGQKICPCPFYSTGPKSPWQMGRRLGSSLLPRSCGWIWKRMEETPTLPTRSAGSQSSKPFRWKPPGRLSWRHPSLSKPIMPGLQVASVASWIPEISLKVEALVKLVNAMAIFIYFHDPSSVSPHSHPPHPRPLDLALREAKNRCRSADVCHGASRSEPTICINYHGQVRKRYWPHGNGWTGNPGIETSSPRHKESKTSPTQSTIGWTSGFRSSVLVAGAGVGDTGTPWSSSAKPAGVPSGNRGWAGSAGDWNLKGPAESML